MGRLETAVYRSLRIPLVFNLRLRPIRAGRREHAAPFETSNQLYFIRAGLRGGD